MESGLPKQLKIEPSIGGHISQKWHEFTTGDQEIDCYG